MIPLRRGFTLIELLVVVGIIGLLTTAALAIINPSEQLQKTRDAQRKGDLRQIQFALEAYNADNNRYPAADGEQIEGAPWGDLWQPYMAKLPKDPLSTKSYLYESDANGTYYRLHAKLENCKDPQKIPEATCTAYNYSVTSSNIAVLIAPTPTPTITPTPTPRPFRRVFVTSTMYKGDLVTAANALPGESVNTGLDGGDKICKTLADASSLLDVRGLTWKAWLSTRAENAVDRVYPPDAGKDNTGYRLVDNTTVITTNKAGLIDRTIDSEIKLDENGEESSADSFRGVWTGTQADGTRTTNTCNSWSDASNGFSGDRGNLIFKDSQWTLSFTNTCDISVIRLYCFEQ